MRIKEKELVVGRRSALKLLGLSSAAMLAGGFSDITAAEATLDKKPKPKPLLISGNSSVAFTTGTDRHQMLFEVLKPFENEIREGLKDKQVIIKPNMVVTNIPLCATHVDALAALLEFLKPIYKGQVIIAESSSQINSWDGFKNYGYLDLENKYNVRFVDLNGTGGKPFFIIDRNLHLDEIQLIEPLVNPDNYVITISRQKNHNLVIMTGGVKNMALGAPAFLPATNGNKPVNFKRNMHAGGPRWCHYNIYLVAPHVRPDLTIIDGVEGMEGDGPIRGTPVDHRIALAGLDPVAVDSMCCKLMGIPVENVGYLNYLAAAGFGNVDYNKIDIIGNQDPDKHIIEYKPGTNAPYQLEWKEQLNIPRPGQQQPAQQPGQQQGQKPQ